MTKLKKQFGNRIAALRKSQGFTQMDLSERADISLSALADIEIGATFPKPCTIEKLKNALGVNYVDMFDFEYTDTVDSAYEEVVKTVDYIYTNRSELILMIRLFLRLIKK